MSLETQCTAKRRGVAVLGSSGSIGVQTLDVIKQHSDKLFCAALAVGTRVEVLEAQARAFGVHSVALGSAALENDARCDSLRAWAHGFFGCGQDAVLELIHRDDVDIVVNSLVGSAGLRISYGREFAVGAQVRGRSAWMRLRRALPCLRHGSGKV